MPDQAINLGDGNLVFAEFLNKELLHRWASSKHQMHLPDYTRHHLMGNTSFGVRSCFDERYSGNEPWWTKPKMPSFVTSGYVECPDLGVASEQQRCKSASRSEVRTSIGSIGGTAKDDVTSEYKENLAAMSASHSRAVTAFDHNCSEGSQKNTPLATVRSIKSSAAARVGQQIASSDIQKATHVNTPLSTMRTSKSSPTLQVGQQIATKLPCRQDNARESWKVEAAVKDEVRRACKKAGLDKHLRRDSGHRSGPASKRLSV